MGGALVLAVTLTPVLCLLCFKNLKPTPDNFLVRLIKTSYLQQLDRCLKHRWLTVLFFAALIGGTACLLPLLGGEFMPQLEEGNLWIRDTAPLNISLERQAAISKEARAIMASYPEVVDVVNQIGRTDDATDTDGYYNSEFFVPLRPAKDWPAVVEQEGWRRWLFGPKRPRTKDELVAAMDAELERKLPGVTWNFSQNIRDNVMESLSGIKGDNSLKIVGPDLNTLQDLAAQAKNIMQNVPGLEDVGVFNVLGQSHLAFRVDPKKCQRWGVQVADVNNVVGSALGAKALTRNDRRREVLRRLDSLAGMAAGQRNVDPRHSHRRGQQPGGPAAGSRVRPLGDRDQPGPSRGRRQPGHHRQSAQQHAAAAAARRGESRRRGWRRRTPTASSRSPAPR